jgi:hypothetical protein
MAMNPAPGVACVCAERGGPVPLRETLGRLWASVWGRGAAASSETDHEAQDRARRNARARFWTELREGRREADARAARPR